MSEALDILKAIGDYGTPLVITAGVIIFLWQLLAHNKEKKAIELEEQKRRTAEEAARREREEEEHRKREEERLARELREEEQRRAREQRDDEERREREKQFQDFLISIAKNKQSPVQVNPYNHAKEDKENNLFNIKVNKILYECLGKIGANRVCLFLFHNGDYDYEGKSFQKMSCTNEALFPMTKPIQTKYQGIFRIVFHYIYEELSERGFFNICDIEDIRIIDPATYDFAKQDNVNACFGANIENKDGYPIGFVVFHFSKIIEDEQKEELIKSLSKIKFTIQGLYLGQCENAEDCN